MSFKIKAGLSSRLLKLLVGLLRVDGLIDLFDLSYRSVALGVG